MLNGWPTTYVTPAVVMFLGRCFGGKEFSQVQVAVLKCYGESRRSTALLEPVACCVRSQEDFVTVGANSAVIWLPLWLVANLAFGLPRMSHLGAS